MNFKAIDHVSHIWSVNSPEMQDTLRRQDEDLGRFVRFLDDEVGRGRWVLVLTADHGAQFDPAVSGAFQVTPTQLEADLNAAFPRRGRRLGVPGGPDEPDLRGRGQDRAGRLHARADLALRPRVHEGAGRTPTAPQAVAEAERDDRVFSAAFPISLLPIARMPARGANLIRRCAVGAPRVAYPFPAPQPARRPRGLGAHEGDRTAWH